MSPDLAIEGGTPVRSAPYPQRQTPDPAPDDQSIDAFERELAAFLGSGELKAIACASRAEAIALAARAVDLSRCEVVVPALHAGDAARAMLAAELRPVPAQIDPETANLAPRGLARAMGEQTRAVLVTHAFGHPAAMDDVLRLAQRGDLAVIEDATDAVGASYRGYAAGRLGHVAALGVGPGHLLSGGEAGEAGAVLVADGDAEERVRGWRAEGGSQPSQPALRVALAELRHAAETLQARRQAAWHLTYELRGVRGIAPMPHGRWIRHAYDRFLVRLRSMLWQRPLPETLDALRAEGIPCEAALGRLLHEDDAVRGALGQDDPRLNAEHFTAALQLRDELIAIPLTGAETVADMNDVAEALRKLARASVAQTGNTRRARGTGEP